MDMRAVRTEELRGVDLDGKVVVISADFKELTVGEIRQWLKASGTVQVDVVDMALFEDFSLPDLTYLSSLKSDDLDRLPPSEIKRAFELAKEVNPDFFQMRSRVVELGRTVLSPTLKPPLWSLSSGVTPRFGAIRGVFSRLRSIWR